MGVINIGSSSTGNCFIIEEGEETVVLDLGFTHAEVQKRYKRLTGEYFCALGTDFCLVTHRHKDHSKGVDSFLDAGGAVYAPESMKSLDFRLEGVESGKCVDNHFCSFVPFSVIHKDMAKNIHMGESRGFGEEMIDIPCFGYVLAFHGTQNIWLYMTDTTLILPPLENVDCAIIECNHDLEVIQESCELHIRRALESHLSLQDLITILKSSDIRSLRKLYISHISGMNLDIVKAKKEIKEVYKGELHFCRKNGGFYE